MATKFNVVHPQFKMHPVYKQVSTARAQSLACLSGMELTVELIKNQTLGVLVYTFISISLRLRSGTVSVQLQLSLKLGWTLALLFLTFHMWQGQKEGCPIGMQQKGENPNEGIYLICQYCIVSQLQAGHAAGMTDKMDDSTEKF